MEKEPEELFPLDCELPKMEFVIRVYHYMAQYHLSHIYNTFREYYAQRIENVRNIMIGRIIDAGYFTEDELEELDTQELLKCYTLRCK